MSPGRNGTVRLRKRTTVGIEVVLVTDTANRLRHRADLQFLRAATTTLVRRVVFDGVTGSGNMGQELMSSATNKHHVLPLMNSLDPEYPFRGVQ